MSNAAKFFTIFLSLTLLLGTGSPLAFLLPLPLAGGLAARGDR